MPHTRKHPAGRLRLAPVLLAALLTACAVPTPMLVDAPIDTAVRAAPAAPAGPSPSQPAPSGVVAVNDPTAAETPPLAVPSSSAALIDKGLASWYGNRFHGRRTASGERYDMHDFTAAHKTLPFGTKVRVRSVQTGKEVVVRINDRGPYKHQRIIDLSQAAITALGVRHRGVTVVELLRE
jgi:rare lipoprotein A